MAPPTVSAIVSNWNGAEHLDVCLPSLRAQDCPLLDIIVADNGSTDHSEAVARRHGATWAPLGRNAGLGPALNFGVRAARGQFLLFLNNDMRFAPDLVRRLAEELERRPQAFATDALQWDWEGRRRIHLAIYLSRRRGDFPVFAGWHAHLFEADAPVATVFASAACMMVRRDRFEALDGFCPDLPVCFEDLDLCWRAWARGWSSVFVPDAACWHRVGASAGTGEGWHRRARGEMQGKLLLATRFVPWRYVLLAWAQFVTGSVRDLACGRAASLRDRQVALSGAVRALGRGPGGVPRGFVFRLQGRNFLAGNPARP